MKKNKRPMGACLFCGRALTKGDIARNEDDPDRVVEVAMPDGKTVWACVKHHGVESILVEK